MVALNRRFRLHRRDLPGKPDLVAIGGVVLLDALPPEPLDRLLREEADRVLEAA